MPITPGGTGNGPQDGNDGTGAPDGDEREDGPGGAEHEPAGDAGEDGEGAEAEGQDDEASGEADGDDADLDGEAEGEGGSDGDGSEVPRGKNARETIRELRARAQNAERLAEERERRLREVDGSYTREEQAAAQARERELLAAMTPEEKAQYYTDKRLERIEQGQRQTQLALRDSTDQNVFSAKAVTDARYRNYAPKVEAKLAEMRQRGAWAPREVILATLIGQEVLAKGSGAAKVLGKGAKARVQNGRVAAPNARPDTSRRGRREPSLEERLANVRL